MLNSLERKIGWLAVPGLPIYIVSAQGLMYVWGLINPTLVSNLLLDPWEVVQGHEYWRLVTFLFARPVDPQGITVWGIVFEFFFLYLIYVCGNTLEEMMGVFAFTLFYLMGALGTILAAFFFGGGNGAFFVNASVLLAFAALNPNFQILVYFIVPVRVKWIAVLAWVWIGYKLLISYPMTRMAILVSLINYFLFFGKTHWQTVHGYIRRKNFESRTKE